jgi:hypothetical protein
MYSCSHIYFVMPKKNELPADVERWFRAQSAGLWPALLGSLGHRVCPCTRAHCPACARGDKHPSFVLYVHVNGRRTSIHIPDDLAPQIEQALANGRALQDLLHEAGRRFTAAAKHERVLAQERRP